MASFERFQSRRPVVLVLLTAVVFLVLDNGIFRSGLYSRVLSPKSVAGHFAAVGRAHLQDHVSTEREVLVLGHSKIEAALSEKMFDEQKGGANVKIVMGSSGGTTEKMWYFLLEHIDPDHRRFAAIVIPIDTYQTPPVETDVENLIDVAQFVAPMLTTSDWRELVASYTQPKVRQQAILGALVSSHLYALDVQDLLLHPLDRRADVKWTDEFGPTFLYKWDGFEGDLTSLVVDKEHAKVLSGPPQIEGFRKLEAEVRFHLLPAEFVGIWTERYHAYRKNWFSRILALYRGSNTKIIFVQVPRWPFEMPALLPIDGAPDLRDFVKPSKNVVVVDGNEFTDLEKPEYFYDVLHVNKIARREFTTRFGARLRAELDAH